MTNEIEFEMDKIILKNAIKAHKNFAYQSSKKANINFEWINFKIDGNELTLSTTDGAKALVSKIELLANYGPEFFEFNVDVELLSKATFKKGELNIAAIKVENNFVEITDCDTKNSFVYELCNGNFPSVEDIVVKEKEELSILFDKRKLKQICLLNTNITNQIEIMFNPNDKTSPIRAKTFDEQIKQYVCIMPIVKEEKND